MHEPVRRVPPGVASLCGLDEQPIAVEAHVDRGVAPFARGEHGGPISGGLTAGVVGAEVGRRVVRHPLILPSRRAGRAGPRTVKVMTASPDLLVHAEAVRVSAAARTRAAHLGAQIDAAQGLVMTRRAELEDLTQRHAVEQADVRRLERLSPTRLWATMRGDVDERLAVERAEADAAGRAVVAAQQRLDHATAAAQRLVAERSQLGDTEGAYRREIAAFEGVLHAHGGPAAHEITAILDELGRVTEESREIDEASHALHDARSALAEAYRLLESAGGWATYDTFFNGGFLADMVKHSRIDAATRAFVAVNRSLESLSNELADIDAPALRGVEISQPLAVFDVLFDNIFSDWMVRDRIARAKDQAIDLAARLDELARYLGDRASLAARRMADLTARRERVVADAVQGATAR